MGNEWQHAHDRATAWISLGMKENILTDPEIPDSIRNRIWSFVNGDEGVDANTLPGDSEEWFSDKQSDSNWVRYCDLLNRKGWPDKVIQSIEMSTRKTMNFLFDPRKNQVSPKYGLVVGHVQSGKTANYTGLISRAADSGYNLIIVLAGLHNNLRKQTQIRLERELMGKDTDGPHVAEPKTYDWIKITTQEDDFQSLPDFGFLSGGNPVIAIVKKNVSPLTKLFKMLHNYPEEKRVRLNLLMIDDESDHATINTKKKQEYNLDLLGFEDDEEEEDEEITDATVINTRLRQILGLFPRSSYVGYTATPFANVLIDPEDDHDSLGKTLYPRDFITALPKPEGHMGLNEFFPDHPDMDFTHASQVNCVPYDEAEELRNLDAEEGQSSLNFELPDSIQIAVMDFMLSGAARRCRGQEKAHHSMLVHTKHTIQNQSPISEKLRQLTDGWNIHLTNDYSSEGVHLRAMFESRWTTEFLSHPQTHETWEQILPELMNFINTGYSVLEINSKSEHALDYDAHKESGLKVIAVGGNRLSRGLTLEGLCSTFFIRESKMYDTLTQMGRWFGFRPNYSDLVRLHITPTLLEWFTWLTGVERELRSDIERYGKTGLKPDSLAVRILKHRKMLPTSRSKMRSARAFQPSLGASSPRTKKFTLNNLGALRENLQTVGGFLSSIGDGEENAAGMLWRDVDPDLVISMLQAYNGHDDDNSFNTDDIVSHINNRLGAGELGSWSVGLIDNSTGKEEAPFSEYGFNHRFGLSTRSRLLGRETIGELMQPIHFAMDLPGELADYRDGVSFSYAKMYSSRKPSNPLLLIYTIDKDSTVSQQSSQPRENLFPEHFEKEHVIGLAIAFPETAESSEERANQAREFWALGGLRNDIE